MDFATLIASREASLKALLAQRAAHRAEQDQILASAESEQRTALTDAEQARFEELSTAKRAMDSDIEAAEAALTQLRAEADADARAAAAAEATTPGAERRRYDEVARVGQEARVYNPDTDKRGKVFLADVTRSFLGDHDAADRLNRHMSEERVERGQYLQRAVGTSAFAGLVVPQYLTDLYAPATAALRPFADVCNKHDLPESGMTVNISRITTATSVALQASQNDNASETDIDDTLLTINVQTAAGRQTLSRQAIERGTGTEEVTLDDLFRRYATTLDSTLITQGTTGLSAVAQATTYTDGSPTAAALWPKILGANANLEAALLGQAVPSHVVMHSRRWNWLQSNVGTSWPFMAQPGIPTQAGGANYGVGYGAGIRGMLPNGLQVVVDNNIATNLGAGTNEDEIYVVASDECHLWEDANAPMFIRAEQTKAESLGVVLVVYGYFAYTFGRYTNGTSKVSGTGLVSPSF